MDQAKQFMSVLKKHHFWVLCGMVALLGLTFWWMATSGLSSEFEANKSAILAKAKDVESVIAISPHPNQKGVSLLDEEIESERKSVLAAWEELYEEQRVLFQWPVDFWGEDFVAHVEAPENKTSIDPKYLDIYARFVPEQVAKLGEIVDAEWKPGGAAGGYGTEGGYSGMSSMSGGSGYPGEGSEGGMYPDGAFDPTVKRHKVQWNPASQQMIMDWFTWTETPSTAAVRVAQEDLWIYQALCGIIAATNESATGPHDAAVQEIEQLSIGYDAAAGDPTSGSSGGVTAQNRIQIPGATGGAGSGSMDSAMMSMSNYEGSTSAEGGTAEGAKPPRPVGASTGGSGMSYSAMMGSEGTDLAAVEELPPEQKLLAWRYVDDTGKPLTAAELETTTQIGYRLMPFRMTLRVDQRQYDKLLIECRNSLLPVVVREVRINPTATGGMGSGGGYGGSSAYPGGGSSSMSMEMSGGYSGGGTADLESHIKTVHLSGVLYLIQPPDPEKLGIQVASAEGAAEVESGADGTAEAEAAVEAPSEAAPDAAIGEATGDAADDAPATPDAGPSPPGDDPAPDTVPATEAADTVVPETEPASIVPEPVP